MWIGRDGTRVDYGQINEEVCAATGAAGLPDGSLSNAEELAQEVEGMRVRLILTNHCWHPLLQHQC
jgi:hypothetical protein